MPDAAKVASVSELLRASGLPPLEARALLAQQLGCTREALVAHPERSVTDAAAAAFGALARRRRSGEPLAYLLGEREFYGRAFAVTPAVLIPRPETELLVSLALDRAKQIDHPAILDLGTGSGCVAITLALEAPQATVVATDIDTAALDIARANATRHRARVTFIESNWYSAIEGRFDLIVANPPYVAGADPHLPDLQREPQLALLAGKDGLDHVRTIVAASPAHLRSGGWLALEHGYDQASPIRDLFASAGFESVSTFKDVAGIARVTSGHLPQT